MNNQHNSNRMYYNNNNNNNCNHHNNQLQHQQQQLNNPHSQSQQQQQQSIMQQYNEQMYAQAMQSNMNFSHQMHQMHSQANGIAPPPPGLSFLQQGQGGNGQQVGYNSYPHYPYGQQQQQNQSQQSQNNSIQQQHIMTQHGQNSQLNQQQQQQINGYSQHQQSSPLQINSQQNQQSDQQQQVQQKPTSKLQKQYSLLDDRITQASEDDRSISNYQPCLQGGYNGQEDFLLEHLELSFFKINPCPNQNVQHNHKQCQFYHGLKDRRRVGTNYSQDPCQYIDSFGAHCPAGEKCTKSHNKVEQLYRPEKYKTKFCTYYPNNCKLCEYGIFCSFAHSENDINTELIHNYEYDVDFYIFFYKTVWCPFNYINHDRGMCVYAHNWQDYRRKPHSVEFGYQPDGCESWDPNSFITEYEIGCPNKQNCKKCHGWKELEYHPKIYRTKPCQQQPCSKGKACPYYHNNQEKRNLSGNIQSELFRYAPRNRITKGLFKASQHLIPKEIKQHQQSGGGSGQNQSNGNNMNSSSKITQFGSSHSLSSQNNNPGGINYQQGQYDNIITQPVKKQASLNSKKGRGNHVLMKMNTCNDLSSNLQEDSVEQESRQYKQFQSTYQEKTSNQDITQSPPLKKAQNNSNNKNNNNSLSNQQKFNRSESYQFDDEGDSNNKHQPQQQEEQKKQLKMAVPFILDGQKDSGKKISNSESQQNSSANKYSNNSNNNTNQSQNISIKQQNSQEYVGKDQLEQILSDHFDNPFTPPISHQVLQRQGTSSSSQGGGDVRGQHIPNTNNYNQNNIQTNNSNFQTTSNPNYSKQNSIQSVNNNNNNSSSNLDNIQKQIIEQQEDEDYDQINALIHNIL